MDRPLFYLTENYFKNFNHVQQKPGKTHCLSRNSLSVDDTERMKLFYRVLLFIIPAFMAILVNASIFYSSCSKQLLPWTVFSIEDERMTLDRCFDVVVNKSATNVQANYSKKEVQEVDYVCVLHSVCSEGCGPRDYSVCVYCTLCIVVYTLTCVCGCVTSSLWYNLMTSYPVME